MIIDYLQILEPEIYGQSRSQELGEITEQLKVLAMELDCPVLAAMNLSRATECRFDHRPRVSDIYIPEEAVQKADVILLLYRDEYYDRDTDSPGVCEVTVAGNKGGCMARTKVIWDREHLRFRDDPFKYMGSEPL